MPCLLPPEARPHLRLQEGALGEPSVLDLYLYSLYLYSRLSGFIPFAKFPVVLLCLQVCGACHARLPANPSKLCPLARCGFDQPPRRNLAAEEMVAAGSVAVDCDNAEHGCLETGVGQEVGEHLLECPYREVPCPNTAC